MALHIREDILAKYGDFYSFALEQSTDALILKGLDDSAVSELCDYTARNIVVKDSPKLTDFTFLQKFKDIENIAIFRCKKLVEIWDITYNPHLQSLVISDCKKLNNIDTISYGGKIEHIFIGGKSFNEPYLSSLVPLASQKSLITLDLAVKKCADTRKIAFNKVWPCLEALTISPNMRKYFLSENEV